MSKINPIEAVILAGGQSRRMGEDKARLRVGRRSLLGHARALAADLGWRAVWCGWIAARTMARWVVLKRLLRRARQSAFCF